MSKRTGKQYTYYCCEHLNSKDESRRCDFMTWDVPVKDNCPVCGQTMFKKSGRGFKRPFCINPDCANFTPEEKRGGYVKKETQAAGESEAGQKDAAAPKAAARKTASKTAAKKTASKRTTAKKATPKKAKAKKAEGGGEEL